MKNTKILIILCVNLFLTAIGCSDYMESAEKEARVKREYRLKQFDMEESDKEDGFFIHVEDDGRQDINDNQRNRGDLDKKSKYEDEQFDKVKQDLEKPIKESEKPKEERKSYWKRIWENQQNN